MFITVCENLLYVFYLLHFVVVFIYLVYIIFVFYTYKLYIMFMSVYNGLHLIYGVNAFIPYLKKWLCKIRTLYLERFLSYKN